VSLANKKPFSRYGRAPAPTIQAASLPASVGGINAYDAIMAMPPEDCIYTFNLMPVEYGLRLRKGYTEWATGINGDVRTLIAYDSASEDPSKDRLWAVTEFGIFNVTNSTGAVQFDVVTEDGLDDVVTEDGLDTIVTEGGSAPVQDVVFADQTDPAGYGVYTEWTNDASIHYLFYADGINGIHQYQEATGWSVPTGWTYDDPDNPGTPLPFPVDDVAFVMAHKLRLWVILENSDDAWYSDIASVAGDFTKFTFGAKMPHGGYLQGLWTWSLDGGNGMDDFLVGISRGGDILVYKGSDPALADWTMVGSWFIGATPRSRRLVSDHGSDMYMLSTYGITSLRDLLQGSVAEMNRNSPSAKINRFLRADIESSVDYYGWAIANYPGDGFLQVITPQPSNTPYVQYNQNTSTRAWGFWRGVPMLCGQTWNGQYFMGAADGIVYLYDGVLDGTTLSGIVGNPISFETLTSFQAPNNSHATYKRCALIRTVGVLAGTAAISIKPVFDYNIAVDLPAPSPQPNTGENVWDSAVWDLSVWDYGLTGRSYPAATLGHGRVMAIGMTGSAANRINIVGWDVMYTEGGLL
jgi:hypothetical protein